MPYPQQMIVSAEGTIYVDTTNEWILINKSKSIHLSADKTMIIAADPPVDVATITLQLTTPILIDDTYDNVLASEIIVLSINGDILNITLNDNGNETLLINSEVANVYVITCLSHTLVVGGVNVANLTITAV